MNRNTIIELFKEGMKFSAGHFTIFSETERENLHGHNFNVYVSINADILENGMCFDYGIYKDRIMNLCKKFNEIFIIPRLSKYLKIEEDEKYVYIYFNNEKMSFLKRDVLLLDIENATLEEFSRIFVDELTKNKQELELFRINEINVKVFSGPGQCANYKWSKF
ncbi:MAG: 6-pyruvoyl tetrahydrobiopterin synthase [Candidatus Sericytochromatia bacterium]|nr:MAG: 6-pyruvoyl tetrahydrobiopterin synthase [Candidatus Sericytochromatia bacterium]